MTPEELKQRVQELLADPVVQECPTIYNALVFPQDKPTLFDWVVQDLDGPYYWERSAYTKLRQDQDPGFPGIRDAQLPGGHAPARRL